MNNSLTYIRCGDYEIPSLTLTDIETKPLGKYGRMRKKYLRDIGSKSEKSYKRVRAN